MRLLADENVHGKVVNELRNHGYEIQWIKETAPGTPDIKILERTDISEFLLITNDRDFGELVFARGLPAPAAILYTRTPHREWKLTATRLIDIIAGGLARGQFVTIEAANVRFKPLPTLD